VAVDDGFAMAGAQLSSEHTGIDFGDSAESGVIDFGDGADTIDFGEGIDFGAGDAIDFGDGADTIDFGGASSIDFGGIVDVGDGADTIDFGDGAGIDFGDVTPASVPVEGIAQSILHHGPTRAAVCDELHEVRCRWCDVLVVTRKIGRDYQRLSRTVTFVDAIRSAHVVFARTVTIFLKAACSRPHQQRKGWCQHL
jgi:hypothetical protein